MAVQLNPRGGMFGLGGAAVPLPGQAQIMPAEAMGNGAPQPFVWGEGGSRLTPEQIAAQLEGAQSRIRADTSPVGHWMEGAARVVDSIIGGLQMRDAMKEQEKNRSAEQEIIEQLTAGNPEAIGRAMTSPSASGGTRDYAGMLFQQQNPKPQAPTEFERYLAASGVVPGSPEWVSAMETKVRNSLDPFTSVVSGGNQISGRQSLVEQALSGFLPQGAPGGAEPPPVLPRDHKFGGPTPTASAPFRY